MSVANAVAADLPYLRRFARALTGSQASGDAYVAATLEALLEDPRSLRADLRPRSALYRLFLSIWNSLDVNRETEMRDGASASVAAASRRLGLMTPLPRQAFLLVSVEGFTPDEAASVLDLGDRDIGRLLDQAGKEISDQLAAKVLIIEDEPLIAADLEDVVTSLGHTVQAVARTHREALAAIEKGEPGLVLADIRLADGSSGLDAVNDILSRTEVPVIFVTAYPERLLTGARPEPTFLINKPYRPDALKAIISQALFFNTAARRNERTWQ